MGLDLVKALASSDFEIRLRAIEELTRRPDDARRELAVILSDVSIGVHARVWAMIALLRVGCEADPSVVQSLMLCIDDAAPVVRRSAIEVVGHLKVEEAVGKVADHLSDHDPIESAWFDDDSTPAQAARRSLLAIGSPEAIALLADTERR
jgi:HEAT repeat protein